MKISQKISLKTWLLSLATCILFCLLVSAALAANQVSTYAALGDSIVSGYGLTDKANDLFVNKLAQKTGAQKFNFGVEGMTTAGLLAEINSLKDPAKAEIAAANLITISIGGNDLMEPLLTADQTDLTASLATGTASFTTNFPQIISALKKLNPKATIIVQTVYNPLDDLTAFQNISSLLEPALTSINSLIKTRAATDGYKVADVYTAFKANNAAGGAVLTNMADSDVHPNPAGHNLIYMANYLALTRQLPYTFSGSVANATVSFANLNGLNLHVTVKANPGYSAPPMLNLTINGKTQTLAFTNGEADLPASALTGNLSLTGAAAKTGAITVSKTTANPSSSTICLSGKTIDLEAYQIGGNNYFKLRDLAQLLSDTTKKFAVTWNPALQVIDLATGKNYIAAGGELTKPKKQAAQKATLTTAAVYLDEQKLNLTAYNINGNNFFKLRDLAQALNFGLAWNSAAKAVTIDPAGGYTLP